jgi:long-chain acyl-CoA synthetase
MTIIDEIRSRALEQPEHPALIADRSAGAAEQVVSYAELIERMDRFAERLRSAGSQPYERTGLLAAQGIGFVEAALGILAAELCFVPISDDYAGAALEGFSKRAQLHCLLRQADDFRVQRFSSARDVDGEGDAAFRALQPAYIRFTSGTTNERKGVIIGHQAILDRLANANQALQIGPADRIMWMLPMAHHFVVSILLYLRYGATILFPRNYLPQPVLEMANTHAASVFYASPYHYDLLAKDVTDMGLPAVRLAISTASGLNLDIAERFFERMQIPLSQALGVIEIGLPVINLQRPREKPLSLGQVLPAYQVWLRGEDGAAITGTNPDSSHGEICIRGSGSFDAYMDPWVPASEIMQPDGFRTGDQGYFDADGDLFLLGRRHNRINMAGMKFFSEEVEAVLNAHPDIKESRVYGQPHAHLGEIPMAEVVAADPAHPPAVAELTAYCKQRLAVHKVPFKFALVSELAHTSTGKIKRW